MSTLSTPSSEVARLGQDFAASNREAYERDGFLVIRTLFAPFEIALAAMEADRLFARSDLIDSNNLRCRWQTNVRTGECTFETFDPVIDIGPTQATLAEDPRLMAVLGGLYGEPACLFKDKLIFKPAGCKGYGLHQDWIAWPGFPLSFLTVLIPLDRATLANGCTVVYRGHHHHGCLSKEDGQYHELPRDCVDESQAVPLELEPGDVAIFGGFTPHYSAPNQTDGPRRQLYLSYNKWSDGGKRRDQHYLEFHAWLRKRYAEHDRHDVYFE